MALGCGVHFSLAVQKGGEAASPGGGCRWSRGTEIPVRMHEGSLTAEGENKADTQRGDGTRGRWW